jgi:hypothetical protein
VKAAWEGTVLVVTVLIVVGLRKLEPEKHLWIVEPIVRCWRELDVQQDLAELAYVALIIAGQKGGCSGLWEGWAQAGGISRGKIG